jgi:hypothetical protein
MICNNWSILYILLIKILILLITITVRYPTIMFTTFLCVFFKVYDLHSSKIARKLDGHVSFITNPCMLERCKCFSAKCWLDFKPVIHLAIFFPRTSKKQMWLGGDVVSVCRQPIKLLFSLFARTNSPSGKQALVSMESIFWALDHSNWKRNIFLDKCTV